MAIKIPDIPAIETGVWVPDYVGGATVATDVTSAFYIKIDKLVIAQCYIYSSNVTSPTASDLLLGGLPYAANSAGSASISAVQDWGSAYPIAARINSGSTEISLFYRSAVNGTESILTGTHMNAAAGNHNFMALTAVYTTA